MLRAIAKIFKHRHKFRVIKTIWPYKEGYGTWCRGCNMVVDRGLSRQQAIDECLKLNRGDYNG